MGVPKKRHTKSKTRSKRAHHALTKKSLTKCEQCGAGKLPHEACRKCGYFQRRSERQTTAQSSS